MSIVCLSDTHAYGNRINIPDGNVLIHAGDHTFRGSASEIRAALNWLASLPHRQSELSADPVDALVVCDDAVSTQHVITDSTETKSRTLI